jgi:5-methylcytosine-specific restriction endonuclease McrA
VDHVVALSCGGEHHARNLQLTHLKCNMEKGVD